MLAAVKIKLIAYVYIATITTITAAATAVGRIIKRRQKKRKEMMKGGLCVCNTFESLFSPLSFPLPIIILAKKNNKTRKKMIKMRLIAPLKSHCE